MRRKRFVIGMSFMAACFGIFNLQVLWAADLQLSTGVVERAGVEFEQTDSTHAVLVVDRVSQKAGFTQLMPLLPGDDMGDAYKPGKVGKDDLLIGVNRKVHWNSSEELLAAVREVYDRKSMVTLQFYDAKTWAVKNIVAGDKHVFNDLEFGFANVSFPAVRVTKVLYESWATKRGLQVGDMLISRIKFQSVTRRRSRMPLVTYSREEDPVREHAIGQVKDVTDFLNSAFLDVKPYRPVVGEKDGLMGYASLISFWAVRDESLMYMSLPNSRYVGLGVQIPCLPYCGKASPVVGAISLNSPAAEAGFQVGDLIVAVNGKSVKTSWDALKSIWKLNYTDPIVCRVLRKDELVDVTAKIGWVVED